MFNTVFSYKKNSYEFNEMERTMLLDLLNHFKYSIKDGVRCLY